MYTRIIQAVQMQDSVNTVSRTVRQIDSFRLSIRQGQQLSRLGIVRIPQALICHSFNKARILSRRRSNLTEFTFQFFRILCRLRVGGPDTAAGGHDDMPT